MNVEKGHKLLEVDSLINSARILVHGIGKWEGKKIGSEQNKSQQLLAPGAYIRQWLLANSRRPLQMTLRG